MTKTKECTGKKKCLFLLLENSRPLSLPWEPQTPFSSLGTLDFLSTCLGIDSLNSKVIKPINPKENQLWILIRRTDAETEAPTLWLPGPKTWHIRTDLKAGKDLWEEEKVTTVLSPACASSSPGFCMMGSAQSDISRVTIYSLDVLLSQCGTSLLLHVRFLLLLLDLHTGFAGGRSGGLVFPSL